MDLDLRLVTLARGLSGHAAARTAVIAENVANADTPGYRARDVQSFAEVVEGTSPLTMSATRTGHITETGVAARYRIEAEARIGAEAPNGNDVSVEDQMMRAAEARHAHEMALGVMRKSLEIMAMTLGRRA